MADNRDSDIINLVMQDNNDSEDKISQNGEDIIANEQDERNDKADNINEEKIKKDSTGIVNTVLAYIHYGISSATPDNVLEVACTHFTHDEISTAKDKLWKECDIGVPPSRNN